MIIECKSNNNLQANGQLINAVGKYLYKHLDSAFKFEKSANMCDVYVNVLYEIPPEIVKTYKIENPLYLKVNEMVIDINLTVYQDKVRMNLIEMDPEEKTIGFSTFQPDKLRNSQQAYELIYAKVIKQLTKEFAGFDFIF